MHNMNGRLSQFSRGSLLLLADLLCFLEAEVEGGDQSVHLCLGVLGSEAEPDYCSSEGCQWVFHIIDVNF
jgi:hypothetical protein